MDVVAVNRVPQACLRHGKLFMIHGAFTRRGGAINQVVLVQEYLGGTEYAADTVSLRP